LAYQSNINVCYPCPSPEPSEDHRNALSPILSDEVTNKVVPGKALILKILESNTIEEVERIKDTGT
jgi:hypothetical protein